MLTQQDAPAFSRGVSDQTGTPIVITPSEKRLQMQVLASRLGMSEPLAGLVLSLLRGEPWH